MEVRIDRKLMKKTAAKVLAISIINVVTFGFFKFRLRCESEKIIQLFIKNIDIKKL